MSPQDLISTLFSDKTLPLLNQIKEDIHLTDFELIDKIRSLSQKKMKEINQWVQSLDMDHLDRTVYRKIRNHLIGIRFSNQKHVVPFKSTDLIPKIDYTGKMEAVTSFKEFSFDTKGITKDPILLKSAFINELILFNQHFKKLNRLVKKLNSKLIPINGLIRIFNLLLPDKKNSLDDLLKGSKDIMDHFSGIVDIIHKQIPGCYPSSDNFFKVNEPVLFHIKSTKDRSCQLIVAQPIKIQRFIHFKKNHKLNLLHVVFGQELLIHKKQILADFGSIVDIFPKIIQSLKEIKTTGKEYKYSRLFRKSDLKLIQAFFTGFTENILPHLTQ